MDRRAFLWTLAGSFVAAPLAAERQSARTPPIVAVVFGNQPTAELAGPEPKNPYARVFVEAMRGLGWIAGQNLTIVWRSAEGQPDRYTALANELVKLKLDVIVVSGAPGPALQKATGTIPIVSVGIGSDIQDVQNLAHPGGNVTGLTTTSDMPLAEKRLELLKEAVPKVSRVAYLSDHGTTRAPGAAARARRVSLVPIPVNDPHALRPALAFLERQQVDASLRRL